jgi:hypothetical protein
MATPAAAIAAANIVTTELRVHDIVAREAAEKRAASDFLASHGQGIERDTLSTSSTVAAASLVRAPSPIPDTPTTIRIPIEQNCFSGDYDPELAASVSSVIRWLSTDGFVEQVVPVRVRKDPYGGWRVYSFHSLFTDTMAIPAIEVKSGSRPPTAMSKRPGTATHIRRPSSSAALLLGTSVVIDPPPPPVASTTLAPPS